MAGIKISATNREDFGKGYARRIRMAGDIPAVIYGHGEDPKHVVLPGHETTLAARHANAIFDLDIEGESVLAMVKDVQRHAIRPEIQHMDLLIVKRGERVEIEVPLHFEGEVEQGAVANYDLTTLLVDADALDAPEQIVVNIEGRGVGEHVTAGDIELPEGVNLVADAEIIVVNINEPEELDVPEPGEEGDTDAEGNPVGEGEEAAEEAAEEAPAEDAE